MSWRHIEKCRFGSGQYIGYAGGRVYRIKRTNSSAGKWWAWRENQVPGDAANISIYAWRLRDMDAKLAALPSPDWGGASPLFEVAAKMGQRATDAEKRDELRNEIANSGDC